MLTQEVSRRGNSHNWLFFLSALLLALCLISILHSRPASLSLQDPICQTQPVTAVWVAVPWRQQGQHVPSPGTSQLRPAVTACSASSTAARGADLPSCLTRSFCSCLLKPHQLFELWLGGLLCCHLSGSHNVPTTASTSWSHRAGTRGRGAKRFSELMCGASSEAKQRSQQSAAKTETSAVFFF